MIEWKAVDQLTATVAVGWRVFKLMTTVLHTTHMTVENE